MARKRVLLVEDDPTGMKMLKDVSENQGYEVSTASDGFRAIDLGKSVFPT